jgi:hypothetical protein
MEPNSGGVLVHEDWSAASTEKRTPANTVNMQQAAAGKIQLWHPATATVGVSSSTYADTYKWWPAQQPKASQQRPSSPVLHASHGVHEEPSTGRDVVLPYWWGHENLERDKNLKISQAHIKPRPPLKGPGDRIDVVAMDPAGVDRGATEEPYNFMDHGYVEPVSGDEMVRDHHWVNRDSHWIRVCQQQKQMQRMAPEGSQEPQSGQQQATWWQQERQQEQRIPEEHVREQHMQEQQVQMQMQQQQMQEQQEMQQRHKMQQRQMQHTQQMLQQQMQQQQVPQQQMQQKRPQQQQMPQQPQQQQYEDDYSEKGRWQSEVQEEELEERDQEGQERQSFLHHAGGGRPSTLLEPEERRCPDPPRAFKQP